MIQQLEEITRKQWEEYSSQYVDNSLHTIVPTLDDITYTESPVVLINDLPVVMQVRSYEEEKDIDWANIGILYQIFFRSGKIVVRGNFL